MIEKREAATGQEWKHLDQGWADLKKKMSEVGMAMASPITPDPVLLNVGGSDVYVPRNILEILQKSSASWTLGDLFGGGEWDKRLLKDSYNRIFLDESPACFRHLIYELSVQFETVGAYPDLATKDLPADELPYASRMLPLLLAYRRK